MIHFLFCFFMFFMFMCFIVFFSVGSLLWGLLLVSCSFNHRKHVVIGGTMTRSRDESLPTEPVTMSTLLLGLRVPTHPSELSVLSKMRDQCCG